MYKLLFTIILFHSTWSISYSQMDKSNHIQITVGKMIQTDAPSLNMIQLGYHKDIGLPINITIHYTTGQGGKKASSLLSDSNIIRLVNRNVIDPESSSATLLSFVQFDALALGIIKHIPLSKRGQCSFQVSGYYSQTKSSYLSNILFDSHNDVIVNDLMEQYSTSDQLGLEINVDYQHRLSEYLSLGVCAGYFNNPSYYQLGMSINISL